MRKIKGLIFDFDGIILDSELPTLQSWQEIYRSFDCELPMKEYYLTIGTTDHIFDPLKHLIKITSLNIDQDQIRNKHKARMLELIKANDLLPGVQTYLDRAKALSLRLGIASSGLDPWINLLLEIKNIHHYFDCVVTSDMVPLPKPAPDLYLSALQKMRLEPDQVIAFEDSPNGLLSAKNSDIFRVAIPNLVTKDMDFSQADLVLSSMSELTLDELIRKVESIQF